MALPCGSYTAAWLLLFGGFVDPTSSSRHVFACSCASVKGEAKAQPSPQLKAIWKRPNRNTCRTLATAIPACSNRHHAFSKKIKQTVRGSQPGFQVKEKGRPGAKSVAEAHRADPLRSPWVDLAFGSALPLGTRSACFSKVSVPSVARTTISMLAIARTTMTEAGAGFRLLEVCLPLLTSRRLLWGVLVSGPVHGPRWMTCGPWTCGQGPPSPAQTPHKKPVVVDFCSKLPRTVCFTFCCRRRRGSSMWDRRSRQREVATQQCTIRRARPW